MVLPWCCAVLLWCSAVAGATTSTSASSSLLRSASSSSGSILASLSSSTSDPVVTIPLKASKGERFFNAYVLDVAVRLDILQPDLWIPDPDYMRYCTSSNSSALTVQNDTSASRTCLGQITSRYGALYAEETATYSDYSDGDTTTTIQVVDRLENPVSIAYPNGIVAEGEVAMADFIITDNEDFTYLLEKFQFVYVNDTNMMAGGLGLSNNPRGTGILDYFLNKELISSRGYSALLGAGSLDDDTYGELLLGGVSKDHFIGDLYSFPVLPYEGLDSVTTLPTILLTDAQVVNANTSQSVSLMSGDPEPVLIDSRLSFNYLPLEVIIRLALQTNAFYNKENDEWIVKCSDVEDSNAEFHYKFGPLTIKAPLASFLYGSLKDTSLTFSSGAKACLLNVSPSTYLGYSSLGLPFLSHAYFVMDNDGGNVGLANVNSDYAIGTKLYTDWDTATSVPSSSLPSASYNPSASFISSGSIPFAKLHNYTQLETLTFHSANSSAADAILTRYSLASIISGEVVVSKDSSSTVGPATQYTSRSSSATGAAGPGVKHWEAASTEKTVIYASLLLIGFLGGVII